MPTTVESILSSPPTEVERIVRLLKDFFAHGPERLGSLRLGVLGVIDSRNDDPQWDAATKEFNLLFSRKLSTFEPLTEKGGKTLKRFALRHQDRDKPDLAVLLAMFVIHQVELRTNLKEERPILKEAFSVDSTLNRVWKFLRSKKHGDLSPLTSGYDIGALLKVLHGAFGTGDHKPIENRLFAGTTLDRPTSTYAMYRYSTGWGGVVKSFLTILSPEINGFESFTFTHVYGPGGDRSSFKRTSRGAVLALESSICFLAGGGMIAETATQRGDAPLNRGLKAFVVPHAAFDPDHRLLTGVMLSSSRNWYPVVGRFAMIHVGFSNRDEITDQTVDIRFFDKRESLNTDIPALCQRFKLGGKDYAEEALTFVLGKINNYPIVDLSRQERRNEGLLRVLTIEEDREPPP